MYDVFIGTYSFVRLGCLSGVGKIKYGCNTVEAMNQGRKWSPDLQHLRTFRTRRGIPGGANSETGHYGRFLDFQT